MDCSNNFLTFTLEKYYSTETNKLFVIAIEYYQVYKQTSRIAFILLLSA